MTDPDQADTARKRLQTLQHHGTLVAYQCANCHFTTIVFGSDYDTHLGNNAWPPGLEMTCCEDSTVRPSEAKRGSRRQHNAMLLLMQEGHRGAAKDLWNRLDDTDLNRLEYRTVTTQHQENEDA